MSFMTVLVAASPLIIGCSFAVEPGLLQLPENAGPTCSLRFVCVTTGSGATQLDIGDAGMFEFRHSEYPTGSADRNESIQLNGDVRAGNLSRSSGAQCFNEQTEEMDFCLNTSIIVHLTSRTACEVLRCRTIFSSMEHDFGNATLTKRPQKPTNLKADFNQSLEEATVVFSWDPETNNCTPFEYSISTMNCGSCPLRTNVSQNTLSCSGLLPGQRCSVSVQVVEQCAISDAETLTVVVPSPETPENQDTTYIIIGAVVGSVALIAIIIIICCICTCVICCCCRSNRKKVKRDYHVAKAINASDAADNESLADSRTGTLSLAKPADNDAVSGSPNPLFDAHHSFVEQKEITDSPGKKQKQSIALSNRSSQEPSATVSLNLGGSSHPGIPGSTDYEVLDRLKKVESEQKQQRQEFSAKFDEIDDQRKACQTRISELTEEIKTLKKRHDELLKKSDEERKQHQAEKEQLEQKIRELKQELSAAKTSLDKLRKKAAKGRRPGSQTL